MQQSIPQCNEVERTQTIHSVEESAMEELDQLDEDISTHVALCRQSDVGVEQRSATVDGDQEEKPQIDEDKVSTLLTEEKERDYKVPVVKPVFGEGMQEDADRELFGVGMSHLKEELNGERPQLYEGDEVLTSLRDEEEEEEAKIPPYGSHVSVAAFDAEKGMEEKISEVDEMPHLEVHSLKDHELEDKGPIFEPAVVDEVMQENMEEKLLDVDGPQPTEGSNGEKPQVAEEDEKVYSMEEVLVDVGEKVSTLGGGLYGKDGEDKVPLFDEIMQEDIGEKLTDFNGTAPAEPLDQEMLGEKVSSLQEEVMEEEEKFPTSEMSCSIDEEENDEHKLSEEQLNEEKPHSVRMQEDIAEKLSNFNGTDPAEPLDEEILGEKVYSLQEEVIGEEEKFPTSELPGSIDKDENDQHKLSEDQLNEEKLHSVRMQEDNVEKLSDFNGTDPAELLDEEKLGERVSSLQEEFIGEEEKLPTSDLSGSIDKDENDEHKLSEEQLNEDKPQSVRKHKKISSPRRGLAKEEEENASSLQEESAEKDNEEFDEKEDDDEMDMDEGGPAMAAGKRMASKRKRGRPPVSQGRRTRVTPRPKEDEELCFICFDGGDLVVCDHRGCPKVYHPSCVNRDEAYFKAKGQWSCGWHICSNCQKSARYMCYTCTYSLCRRCIKEADFVCVRENKGFCEPCMKTVMLIEMSQHTDETTDVIDFDDKASWMYLFKDYWVDVKEKLSLTTEELKGARNPFKETNAPSGNMELLDEKGTADRNNEPSENPGNASEDIGGSSSSSSRCRKESTSSRKKVKKRPRITANKERYGKVGFIRTSVSDDIEWASKELLEFVAHMKDGDRSVLSHFDVQALLLEYIKQNNLRDPHRKSQVVCDSRLRALFGKSRVGHLEMLKLLEPHFLIKEASPLATDDNQGGVVDPDPSQTDAEGNSDASTKMSLDTRRKSRRRVEEKARTNLEDYAAIDVHNVGLMYLRRNLMEDFLDVIDMFNENVIGSFVRIRISGSSSNKDMYRLVKVIGTGKAAEKYKTGKKTTDVTLEILNLNKREFITIDLISNQEFTEEECKRLRQSVKCGFIDRLTVAEVQEKASALHAIKFNDWLESEKLRLGHLRDRASEKGRKKEHRECVEKLQLLSTPEERIRRLNEVPKIHIDPNLDPDYDSTEDEDELNAKGQDNNRVRNSSFKIRDDFSARRGHSATWQTSGASDLNKTALKLGARDAVVPIVSADRTDVFVRNQESNSQQAISPKTPKAETNASGMLTNTLRNAQPGVEPGCSSGVQPETALQPLLANVMSSNPSETEKMWHYQDPAGKIQGPFSMTQLKKWNKSGFFPTNLRIWRTSENQEKSILLTDALNGKFQNGLPLQEPQHCNSSQPTNVAVIADTRLNNLGSGGRENNVHQNTASFPATGGYNLAQSDTGRVDPMDRRPATSSTGCESSKNSNAWSGQSQAFNNPRSVTSYSRNSSHQQSFQGRDGRGENNGRWNGGRGHQNNWNSNKNRRFQANGRGYERQHSYQSSSRQTSNNSNLPAHAAPQPSGIDWASLQGAINRILPSSSPVQPMSSGPATVSASSEVQQSQANLTSPAMNSIGGCASNFAPNVNPPMTQESVAALSNIQPQNRPSETAALIPSGNDADCSGSINAEFVDRADRKQRVKNDYSNAKPTSKHEPSDVLNSGCIQPPSPQLNGIGDVTAPSHEPDTDKKCPEAHDTSASEQKKDTSASEQKKDTSASEQKKVVGTGTGLHPASVAPAALGSSDLPQASVSAKRSEASSSIVQTGSQCWAPASSQSSNMGWVTATQNPNTATQNPNPATQNPNPATGTVHQIGNMVYPAMPGAANMGWGMMAHGLMNMAWGTHANVNMGFVPPAQPHMNANLGWAIPVQGNANASMAWGAQAQAHAQAQAQAHAQAHANHNAGWGMPMQISSAENPGWVAPNTGNTNPNPCWVAPTEGNANQNAAWGTPMRGSGQGSMHITVNPSGCGGKTNSNGDGGSSRPLPQEQRGVCPFHKKGHCKKGASCNLIHS